MMKKFMFATGIENSVPLVNNRRVDELEKCWHYQYWQKVVYPFALEKDIDVSKFTSNLFTMQWPPKSGKQKEFPEIDKARWFDYKTGRDKLNGNQSVIIDELVKKLKLIDKIPL